MLKIYLDNCCYNRPFDDLRQEKINLEANAIENILEKHIAHKVKIYTSRAIDYEINKISSKDKKDRWKIYMMGLIWKIFLIHMN